MKISLLGISKTHKSWDYDELWSRVNITKSFVNLSSINWNWAECYFHQMSIAIVNSVKKLYSNAVEIWICMTTSSNGNIFRVKGSVCEEFTGHRWIPRTKAIDAELWCFLWSAPWINGWVNNREAGDLRRQRAHYNVIVMLQPKL